MERGPWLCAGDFNEILDLSEKWGGNGQQRSLMEAFKNTLEVCELHDLGYRGSKFTWSNGREGAEFTKERLDRMVANQEWCDLFPFINISIEAAVNSDHTPLHLTLQHRDRRAQQKRKFRYEANWGVQREYGAVVK